VGFGVSLSCIPFTPQKLYGGSLIDVMMAAAYEGKTVKMWLMDLARARLVEMVKRGILPKGKG